MYAGCVRWMLSHTVRAVCSGSPGYRIPPSRFLLCTERSNTVTTTWRWSPFCTAVDGSEQTPAPKKKKQDPRAHNTISSVGRKIPHRHIQLISETGENMGTMHRADVLSLMEEKGLKLVVLSANKDPPVYRLMSGKQIHEEQLKLREKQKARTAPVQIKELTFTSGIGTHDLTTKLKQVESWLEKKHHVRITVRSGRGHPTDNLDTNLEQMMEQMGVPVAFVNKPKIIRDGRAAMCIVRPPSVKELSEKKKNKTSPSQPDTSSSQDAQPKTSPVSSTDTTEGATQQ